MNLTVKPANVAAGVHTARFRGIKTMSSKFGDGLLWCFVVSGGLTVNAMTPTDATPVNRCGKMQGITGKPLVVGENVDLTQFVGKLYIIEVALWTGGSKVVGVKPK